MTDRPDAPDPDATAELASALHDGEAAAHERARADDPEVVAAQRVVAAIAAQVGDVPAPPAGLVDDHVAAALAGLGDGADDRWPGVVVPIAGRRPWTQRLPLGAVAAAVAVIALVGALGFATAGDDDDTADDTATAALDADEAGDGAVAEAFDAETGATAGGDGGTALAGGEREAFDDYDELAGALADRVDRTDAAGGSGATADDAVSSPAPATEEAERSGAAGCDPVAAAGLDPAEVRLVSPVLVADRLVTALVHGPGDDLRLSVVDDEACAVVERRPLPR